MNKPIYKYKSLWLMIVILAYILTGKFYIPGIIQQQLTEQLNEQLGMQTELSEVAFNPLTFHTTIKDLSITDQNQVNWYQSLSTSINFDPTNLLWGQWKFSALQLRQPNIQLLTNEDGQVVIPHIPELAPSSEGSPIDLVIDDIQLIEGQMNFQADNIKNDFSLNFKNIQFSHEKFSQTDEDTDFEVALTTAADETIALQGTYNHQQQQIKGRIQLKAWQATTLNQIIPDELNTRQAAGEIDGSGEFNWHLEQKPQIELQTLNISGLSSQWQDQVQLTDMTIQLQGIVIDTESENITVEQVTSTAADWHLKWPLQLPENNSNNDSTNAEQTGWQVHVNAIEVTDWPVVLTDDQLQAELVLNIDQLNLKDLNNQAQNSSLQSQITLEQGGRMTLTSEQILAPLKIDSQLSIEALHLPQLAPWVQDTSGLVLAEGTLQSQQQFAFMDQQFDLSGDLTVSNAKINNPLDQNIATVGQLQIGATQISSSDKTIVVDQISLDQAQGNIIIDADQNINIQNLKPSNPDTEQASTPNEWVIKVGAINIKDASTALIDQSIEPAVTTQVSELNGAIKGLSSESLSKADVSISGKFNQFSPLTIEGQINPLSSDAYTDIKINVDDLDLLAFSPYAASYLAFPINGGKLNIELSYSLNENELRGHNNLLFKQFKLGDRQPSPDAINLPLKLAVSLLSNSKGEMKIDLPVSGNITDPEFSYGGLIGKAFFKLITNIVASPFKILGALIPNPDPNLSEIQFTAGSATLLDSEQNKLNQIAEIMNQKTQLNLQLNPHVDQAFDRSALQANQLLSQAPFTQLDFNQPTVTQWLTAQITADQLITYSTTDGINYDQLWRDLISQQTIDEGVFSDLIQQRNLNIKNHLIEVAGITAERIFIEQSQATENNQALIKIGVSR